MSGNMNATINMTFSMSSTTPMAQNNGNSNALDSFAESIFGFITFMSPTSYVFFPHTLYFVIINYINPIIITYMCPRSVQCLNTSYQ